MNARVGGIASIIIDTGDLNVSPLGSNTGSDTSKGWYKWKADLDITLIR